MRNPLHTVILQTKSTALPKVPDRLTITILGALPFIQLEVSRCVKTFRTILKTVTYHKGVIARAPSCI